MDCRTRVTAVQFLGARWWCRRDGRNPSTNEASVERLAIAHPLDVQRGARKFFCGCSPIFYSDVDQPAMAKFSSWHCGRGHRDCPDVCCHSSWPCALWELFPVVSPGNGHGTTQSVLLDCRLVGPSRRCPCRGNCLLASFNPRVLLIASSSSKCAFPVLAVASLGLRLKRMDLPLSWLKPTVSCGPTRFATEKF